MERTYDEEVHKRINHPLRERTILKMEMFRGWNQNRVNTCGKQRASVHTVGESKMALESYFEEHAQEI